MIYFKSGSPDTELSPEDMRKGLYNSLKLLGERKKVLVVPPDFTRFHSRAGELTRMSFDYFGDSLTDVLPALGSHTPMTDQEIDKMFPGVPKHLFRIHDWRDDIVTVGIVPGEFVSAITDKALDFEWPAQLNKLVAKGNYDLILSIGQVVPHEVIGMANYNKNLFVGTGGAEGLNKSHYIGAVYGMERLMGRADNPVRKLLNYASENFIKDLPVVYVLTVIGYDQTGCLVVKGLFIGDDEEVFLHAANLSMQVNITVLDKPLKKAVVYLNPEEFKSTWLGNKSIYRTRMAMADGGELIILAPGLKEFGEDPVIDKLIRKYGYRGTKRTLESTRLNEDLKNNLSAAAHLIHGSSEDRFSITYCPGYLTQNEIESVNFKFASLDEMVSKYKPANRKDGINTTDEGEEFYFISNPAVGLWAFKDIFN